MMFYSNTISFDALLAPEKSENIIVSFLSAKISIVQSFLAEKQAYIILCFAWMKEIYFSLPSE